MLLTYDVLKGPSFINHTKKTLSGKEELTYYIDKTNGWQTLHNYFITNEGKFGKNNLRINAISHDLIEQNFIRSTLQKLDEIIDIDFKEMSHNNGSMLDIYRVNYASSFGNNVIGQALSQSTETGYWWDIYWKKYELNEAINKNLNLNTIVHEIGHTLGLKHPFDDPNNKLWSTKDTVMSYNRGPEGWDTWFSNTDLNALISIWGRENDNGIMKFNKESKTYKYIQSTNHSYQIKSEIGLEDITNINTLNFIDHSIKVKEDIIGVFDLLNEVDDITGKIYRLYNAAFNRFPDKNGLIYWINKNVSGEDTYRATASSFIISKEFIDSYGKDTSNKQYINNLYKNILNRNSDSEGFNYWNNQLEKGLEDRSELLMGFSESAENKSIFSAETNIF